MSELVLIAPFENLAALAREIVRAEKIDIAVMVGDLQEGVEAAKKAVAKGAQVIISRGGTYTMIKNAVKVPVVEIELSSYDILRGFNEVLNTGKRIAVTGYKNVVLGSGTVAELLNLDVELIVYDEDEKVPHLVLDAKNRGVEIFIGDAIGYKVAHRLGCEGYLITSGKESVQNAIKEAKRILYVSKVEKEKAQKLKMITDFVHDAIVAVDDKGCVTMFNSLAEEIFQQQGSITIGKQINEIVPGSRLPEVLRTGQQELGSIQDINGMKVAINRVPIIVDNRVIGAVATFQDITQIQELEYKIRKVLVKKGLVARYSFDDIIYKSRLMKECISRAKSYSAISSPALILGQSGVGKELFAQSIHNYSNRAQGPFVAVNCAALPPNLLESELFGYVEGAFTGARRGGKPGIFELAHKGTIFLDEVGELPPEFQARLLRVLQEKEVMRIGDDKVIPIDVRIIAATNKDIERMVDEKGFREDLYYRINVLTLYIPSLNERKEDVGPLSAFFCRMYSKKYNKRITSISREAQEYLNVYSFKGNVRELEGIMERAVALSKSSVIEIEDVLPNTSKSFIAKAEGVKYASISLKELEILHIKDTVKNCGGNISRAAEILGINRSTLWRKLKG